MSAKPQNWGCLLLAIALSLAALVLGLFDIWQRMVDLSTSRVSGNILDRTLPALHEQREGGLI